MATQGVDFVLLGGTAAQLTGGTVKPAPYLMAVEPLKARAITGRVAGGAGTGVLGPSGVVNNGRYLVEGFAGEGFALNGAIHITTTGTTPVSVDLTNLATGATSQAGDATFAKFNKIRIYNVGAAAMTVAPGGTNPATLGLAGTTPTLSLPPGTLLTPFANAAGVVVDATKKIITITPTAGGDVIVAVGGS